MVERTCACKSIDAYECWHFRYRIGLLHFSRREIDDEGGPCECGCHDPQYDDEEWS